MVDTEVKRLVDEAYARATQILSENRELLDRIAVALLDRETIDREDLDRLVKNLPLAPRNLSPDPAPAANPPASKPGPTPARAPILGAPPAEPAGALMSRRWRSTRRERCAARSAPTGGRTVSPGPRPRAYLPSHSI